MYNKAAPIVEHIATRLLYALILLSGAILGNPALTAPPVEKQAADIKTWQAEVAASEAAYREQLAALVEKLPAATKPTSLTALRAQLRPADPHKLWLANVPASSQVPPECQELGIARAKQLFELAKQGVELRQVTAAWELLHQAMLADPDFALARLVLGYQRHDEEWMLPQTAELLSKRFKYHEKFGWLPPALHDNYDRGERRFRDQTITSEEDAAAHADIQNGWKIETEHYNVVTNHSLEEGVRMGRRLEELHSAWRRVFIGYLLSPEAFQIRISAAEKLLRSLAEGGNRPLRLPLLPGEAKKLQIVLFATRDQYNAALKPAQPRIDMTLGIYFASTKTAYFFAGADQDPGTVLHEATHQLFQETRKTSNDAGSRANFWLLEGVACYFETLAATDQGYTLGGGDGQRVLAARVRLLNDGFYIPLEELSAKGMLELQRDPNLPKLYSQSAGLTQFLIHADNGALREPLAAALRTIYANPPKGVDLSTELGRPFDKLDAEYRAYLKLFGTPPGR